MTAMSAAADGLKGRQTVSKKIAWIASGKALQPADDDQNVADAPVLQFVHNSEPELGALGLLDPNPRYLLRTVALWYLAQPACLTHLP